MNQFLGLIECLSVYHGLSRTIFDHLRRSHAILEYIGLCQPVAIFGFFFAITAALSGYIWQSLATSSYLWLTQAILGYLLLSRAISIYLDFTLAISGYL